MKKMYKTAKTLQYGHNINNSKIGFDTLLTTAGN